ncbi:MAG: hypothetical protein WA194_08225 [Patescibacteria group bacterium]
MNLVARFPHAKLALPSVVLISIATFFQLGKVVGFVLMLDLLALIVPIGIMYALSKRKMTSSNDRSDDFASRGTLMIMGGISAVIALTGFAFGSIQTPVAMTVLIPCIGAIMASGVSKTGVREYALYLGFAAMLCIGVQMSYFIK